MGNVITYIRNDPFMALIIVCIVGILIYGLFCWCTNKQGKWSDYFMIPDKYNENKNYKKDSRDSKGELECRRILEKIFRKAFSKDRPEFLNNPVTGGSYNLELDCYNKELGLAVEYSGAQHYKYIPYFHKNKEAFLNQKYRDYMKKQMCKDNNIVLIEVPYTVKIEHIENFLRNELRKYYKNI